MGLLAIVMTLLRLLGDDFVCKLVATLLRVMGQKDVLFLRDRRLFSV